VLEELLNQREEKIQQEKHQIAEELRQKAKAQQSSIQGAKPMGKPNPSSSTHIPQPSRYIPAKVKHLLKQEYGSKCAKPGCINTAVNIHHKLRFALNPIHDPLFMLQLCKPHHEIVHTVDVKVVEKRLEWRK
jgi:hypothetical protein